MIFLLVMSYDICFIQLLFRHKEGVIILNLFFSSDTCYKVAHKSIWMIQLCLIAFFQSR